MNRASRVTTVMLEIACFNASSAIAAAEAGADRIELCADYSAGGVTPSLHDLESINKSIQVGQVPINVMIRPRAGNFNYSTSEFEQMKAEVQLFKPKASGFVFGILDDEVQIDERRNHELVQLAAPLPCTFHRAFDELQDLEEGFDTLIQCGFKSVLTSGGRPDATAGAAAVAKLQEKYGDRISIILGGGVRASNIQSLREQTKVDWYHSAAITQPGESVDSEEVARIQVLLKER